MSKYDPLWEFIRKTGKARYDLSFSDIARILGFEIDHSFLTYKKESLAFGYEVKKISLKRKTVLIEARNG
jgi:hypothetical protein